MNNFSMSLGSDLETSAIQGEHHFSTQLLGITALHYLMSWYL